VAVMTIIELDNSALRSTVAFTGRLACMSRADAFEVVRSHGGTPSQAVTRQTNVLVVGELGWPLLDDGRPSNKLSRAGSYGIPVVSERRFLEWIGKAVPDSLNRTYPAEQIAARAGLRRKLLYAQRPALIRPLRKLGTIFPTCWTSRAGQKPRSIVCARRCGPPRPTLMRFSISRFCFNGGTSTRKLRNTGGNISPLMLNLNGQHGRGGH